MMDEARLNELAHRGPITTKPVDPAPVDHLDTARMHMAEAETSAMERDDFSLANSARFAQAHATIALVEVAQGIEMAVDRVREALTEAQGLAPHGHAPPAEGASHVTAEERGGVCACDPTSPADAQLGEVWERTLRPGPPVRVTVTSVASRRHHAIGVDSVGQHWTLVPGRWMRMAQGAHAPHDGAGYPGEGHRVRGGVSASAPTAPVHTPQEGEVWEDTTDGERVLVLAKPDYHSRLQCRVVVQGGAHNKPGDTVGRYVRTDEGWRRVSPAPAPLTEREVTAEVTHQADVSNDAPLSEHEGVEPATDEQIAAIEGHCNRGYSPSDTEGLALIARVRAADARAEAAELRCMGEVRSWQAFRERAEASEAQVERMRPVVTGAMRYVAFPGLRNHQMLANIVRAYRAGQEATDGE